jgi:hypothetical protein
LTDEFFRKESAKRARRLYLISGLVIGVICLGVGVISLFYDSCTRSFDRSPQGALTSYIDWITQGNQAVQDCWVHNAYFTLDSGCSEICIQRVLGKEFTFASLSIQPAQTSSAGSLTMTGTLDVACKKNGKIEKGEFTLYSPNPSIPWKHWRLLNSNIGGTLAEPWCK